MAFKTSLTVAGICLCGISSLKAQQLSPQAVNSAGYSSASVNIILESSVGGLVVEALNSSTFMYTPDFLQPDAGATAAIPVFNNVALSSGAGIDNAGTTLSTGNTMIEFTVGEMASITLGNNNMITQGILQPFNTGGALPVTGLEFTAQRINPDKVELHWKTNQEINNRGFSIERKKDNEYKFTTVGFVHSIAGGGNSSMSLEYRQTDENNYPGKTFYRLQQQDFDGKSTYSIVRVVNGSSRPITMQVWPVPATGPVQVLVNGIVNPDRLQVYDLHGRLVKQYNIVNNSRIIVTGLMPGTYIVRLAANKDMIQKIVVQ